MSSSFGGMITASLMTAWETHFISVTMHALVFAMQMVLLYKDPKGTKIYDRETSISTSHQKVEEPNTSSTGIS